jgi:hypothetical protein
VVGNPGHFNVLGTSSIETWATGCPGLGTATWSRGALEARDVSPEERQGRRLGAPGPGDPTDRTASREAIPDQNDHGSLMSRSTGDQGIRHPGQANLGTLEPQSAESPESPGPGRLGVWRQGCRDPGARALTGGRHEGRPGSKRPTPLSAAFSRALYPARGSWRESGAGTDVRTENGLEDVTS